MSTNIPLENIASVCILVNIKLASVPRNTAGETIYVFARMALFGMLAFSMCLDQGNVVKSHVSFLGQGHGSLFPTRFQKAGPVLYSHAHKPVSMAKSPGVFSLIF